MFVITYDNIKPPYQPKAAVMSRGRMRGRGGGKRREGEGSCLLFEQLNVSCCTERGRGGEEVKGCVYNFVHYSSIHKVAPSLKLVLMRVGGRGIVHQVGVGVRLCVYHVDRGSEECLTPHEESKKVVNFSSLTNSINRAPPHTLPPTQQ